MIERIRNKQSAGKCVMSCCPVALFPLLYGVSRKNCGSSKPAVAMIARRSFSFVVGCRLGGEASERGVVEEESSGTNQSKPNPRIHPLLESLGQCHVWVSVVCVWNESEGRGA